MVNGAVCQKKFQKFQNFDGPDYLRSIYSTVTVLSMEKQKAFEKVWEKMNGKISEKRLFFSRKHLNSKREAQPAIIVNTEKAQ